MKKDHIILAIVACVALLFTSAPSRADFVINDDLIVDGSACIGFDCVNGESFGFDTIRLKENNLRIKFDDTSVAASFPRNDWQLTANDSANGGTSKFSIDDISGNRTPFTIEANARSHSLYVDAGGRIGIRTSTPAVEIHVIDGDTPTLRLQQDGSSGFAPQTWDVAGNETNFFIRDVTNGSQLPFRIRPDAPTSSIFIDVNGDVGIATASPSAALHVRRTDGEAKLLVEEASGTSEVRNLFENINNGNTTWRVVESSTGNVITFNWAPNLPRWNLTNSVNANNFQFDFGPGNLTIDGDFITDANTYPDYVFDDDYELLPLSELASFVRRERHLPGVPSQADVDADGGRIRLAQLQLALLEKIEELALYTIDQQKTIDDQQTTINALSGRLEVLESPKVE